MSPEQFNAVCITLDVDWADEEMIEHTVERLVAAGLRATFFATHNSAVLSGLDPDRFEVGLHPDFERSNGDFERPLAELKGHYPSATGGRSHGLFVSSRILQLYAKHGLSYESNMFLLEHPHLQPALRFADLVSIPFNWSDDKHLELGRQLDGAFLTLDRPGLMVMNFHPVHVFMNTSEPGHYESFQLHQNDPAERRSHINRDSPGIGTLLDDVGAAVAKQGSEVALMGEIRDRFVAAQK